MDVPSTVSGVVENVVVGIGDKVSDGDLVGNVSSQSVQNPEIPIKSRDDEAEENEFRNETDQPMSSEDDYDLVVLGAGPGGYAAAFRASDLGLKVALVDRNADLGGVCLNVGCIPSKAFLHAAKILDDSKEAEISGIKFNEPEINLSKMKTWKNNIIGGLTGGLKGLAKETLR